MFLLVGGRVCIFVQPNFQRLRQRLWSPETEIQADSDEEQTPAAAIRLGRVRDSWVRAESCGPYTSIC